MLAFRMGSCDLDLREVAPYLLQHARERKGDWEITVFGNHGDSYKVRYTEEEYAKLARVTLHGLRNGTKHGAFCANLENAAQTLWPTGSVDHVAMRHVGVVVAVRYITKRVGQSRLPAFLRRFVDPVLQCVGIRRKFPALDRVEKDKEGAKPKGGTKKGKDGDKPDGPGKGGDKPDPPKPGGAGRDDDLNPPELVTPCMPDDDENCAGASADGRTIVKGDVVAVLGQNFNKDEPVNHMPIVGLMVGPCQVKPNVYSKTASNLQAAIDERITKKAVKPDLSKAERQRLGNVVRAAMSNSKARGVFSKHNIHEWALRHFDLEACKSGKWSNARFKASLDNLYSKEHPTFSFKADVKLECMPEGKAPRMLIADGDDGQLMALAVVKCFEDLLFEHFEDKSIKHLPKREALDRVVRELKRPGAKAVEGDGSAWDTTCNDLIRSLVENPILRHIFQELAGFGVIPEGWMEEHSRACESKKLNLFFSNKFESMRATINAIRRSGHRGTSCLNWWINFVMWICSIFREPERFLDVRVRTGEDLTGTKRWWNGCFEGDDSLCTMNPPMVEGDKLSEIFLKFWKSGGFNMKIVFCKDRATFVGWHIGCTNGELNNFRSPELPRALANSGVSVSTEAIAAAKSANRRVANVLAAASALARASDFSGILPSVSKKYLEFADSLTQSNFQDREMSIRACGKEGHGAEEIRETIRNRNVGVSPQDELITLRALGYPATSDEIDTFSEYIWSMEPSTLTDYESFRDSLPPTWRK